MTTVHRVVLAADNVLLREGLACVLDRSGFEVPIRIGSSDRANPVRWIRATDPATDGVIVSCLGRQLQRRSPRVRADRTIATSTNSRMGSN